MPSTLTQARLKELLHYDPETGHFTWRVSNSNRVPAGSRAGTDNGRGYFRIQIDGRSHFAHRLAFLYMTGEFPLAEVDHINRGRADNRWKNLRPAARRENQCNIGLHSNNTSGHCGVSRHKQRGKWHAYGRRDGRMVHLGLFASLEEAAAVARKWREENFGEFVAEA